MIKYLYSIFLCFFFHQGFSFASNTESRYNIITRNLTIGLSLAPSWYNVGKTQNIWFEPSYANTYVPTVPEKNLINGELFLGWQKPCGEHHIWEWGVALSTNNSAKLQGYVWQNTDPQFNNFIYHYKIKHSDIRLKSKLLYQFKKTSIYPYVAASIGFGRNVSYSFYNTPVIYEALPIEDFRNHNITALTYTLGIGIQKIISKNWQLGIGYQMNDWGRSSLSASSQQISSNGLSLNHLYIQSLQFTLNFLF